MIPQHESGRAPRQATKANGADPSRSLLTLRQAARLSGLRRRALRERIQRGQVDVRVVGTGRKTKLRLTSNALAAAGLLPGTVPPENPPVGGADLPAVALLELLREQNTRIASLEEQRFQLAGQLGAALERSRALEDRVLALTAAAPSSPAAAGTAVDIDDHPPNVSLAGAAPDPPTLPHAARPAAPTASPTGRSRRVSSDGAHANAEPGPQQPRRTGANRRSRWPLRVVAALRRRAAVVAPRGPRPGDRGAP